MEFREFCNYVRENILGYFPDKFSKGDVTVDGTMKNNGVFKQGLSIRTPDSNIAPKVYLEEFYREYDRGVSLEEICQRIAYEYQNHIIKDLPFARETVADYDKAKPLITMKVVAAKTNKMFLKEQPFTKLDDLAILYQIEVNGMPEGRATIPITNNIFQEWNVPLSEVHNAAMENTERLFPSKLITMEAILLGAEENLLYGSEYHQSDIPMLVLTNSDLNGGAAAIANPDILHRVSEVINDNYYMMPSSIHEVIILPKTAAKEMGMSTKEMGGMVRNVNAEGVRKEEQLSNHIYEYDKDKKVLETVKDSKEKSMDMER